MPVNTEEAVSSGPPNRYEQIQARLARRREQLQRSTSGSQGAETQNLQSGAGDAAAAQRLAAERNARLSGAGDAAAAQRFIAEREARLSGAGDEAAAQAIIADRANNTPAPSTVQATNAPPAGTTTPSLSARRNTTFTNISPRPYFRIDPLDNRYDFLTGQKINTTGGQPNVNTPVNYPGANTTGGTGTGGNPGTSEIPIGYNEGQVDPALAEAAGLEGNVAEQEAANDLAALEAEVFRTRVFALTAARRYQREHPGFAYRLRRDGTEWRVVSV